MKTLIGAAEPDPANNATVIVNLGTWMTTNVAAGGQLPVVYDLPPVGAASNPAQGPGWASNAPVWWAWT